MAPSPAPLDEPAVHTLAAERLRRSVIVNRIRAVGWTTFALIGAALSLSSPDDAWVSVTPMLAGAAALAWGFAWLARRCPVVAAYTGATLVVDVGLITWVQLDSILALTRPGVLPPSASGTAGFNASILILVIILAGVTLRPRSLAAVTPVALVTEMLLQHVAEVGIGGRLSASLVIALAGAAVAYASTRDRNVVSLMEHDHQRLDARVREQASIIAAREVEAEAAIFAARSAELARERQAAEVAASAKAQFLANMSHELRTPLNAVLGMSSLLAEADLPEPHREQVEIIRASGEHVLGLINDILDFSKIEADRVDLEALPVAIGEIVEPTLDLVSAAAHEHNVELAWEMARGTPARIVADPGRVRQVLLNLLSNGVKFTEHGAVLLSVSAAREGSNHRLTFAVRDTGAGIPEDARARLFQAFSQGDASTTRTHGGTGLGLVISARLASRMGGGISFESEVGKGSIFTFTMVAREAELSITPPGVTAEGASQGNLMTRLRRSRPVVVAYQSELVRDAVARQIEVWGLSARRAATASDAASAAREVKASAIVLDGALLGSLNGNLNENLNESQNGNSNTSRATREVLEEVLGSDAPPVILVSRGTPPRHRQDHGALAGPVLLGKPLKLSVLRDTLAHVVAGEDLRMSQRIRVPSRPGDRPPLRVLVAEDNAMNQKVAAALLRKLGHSTDFVANGVEAVAAVSRRPYDIVLMDVQMPEMDGLQATREILRRSASGPRPRIVGLTASALPEDREACRVAGMDDYISKPVTLASLNAALSRCLAGSEGGSS